MTDTIKFHYEVDGDDFPRAGEASGDIKRKLKQMGVAFDTVRKVSIAMYEGEINMVIHAHGGCIDVLLTEKEIQMVLKDIGPGIEDIEKAMRAGFSTAPDDARELGFGAGMGLPNMQKYSDELSIDTTLGVGTTVTMKVFIS